MVAGDLVNTASRIQSVAEPGTVLRRRGDAAGDRGDGRLRGRRRVRAEGQGRPVPLWRALRVVSGLARLAQVASGLEAPFVGRDRELRQIKDLFHACADERRAHLVSVTGIAGIGKSRLGWEFYKYFDGLAEHVYWHRGRCLAYGEGVDLLGARRHGADALPDRRGRGARRAAREAARDARGAHPRRRRAALRRAAARPPARARRARRPRDRQDLFAAWRLFFERLADDVPDRARLRGHAVGRREPARLRRVPARVVAEPPALRDHARPARSCSSGGRPGAPASGTSPRSTSSRSRRRRWRSSSTGLVPGLPDDAARRRSSPAPRASRSTRSRRCGCCSTAACSSQDGAVYRLDRPDRGARGARDAARADRGPPRRALARGAARCSRTPPCSARPSRAAALAALAGLDERASSSRLLASLVRKEVLGLQADPRSPEHGQYGFLQDLVRHVAYETLSKRERRARHLAAAEHLEPPSPATRTRSSR